MSESEVWVGLSDVADRLRVAEGRTVATARRAANRLVDFVDSGPLCLERAVSDVFEYSGGVGGLRRIAEEGCRLEEAETIISTIQYGGLERILRILEGVLKELDEDRVSAERVLRA